jgi:translation initiation factor IF-1
LPTSIADAGAEATTKPETALSATVTESLPNKRYGVRLIDGRELHAVLSPGCKERQIEPGKAVTVELSTSDPLLCRIIPGHNGKAVVVRKYR